jgi:hypothetical protein
MAGYDLNHELTFFDCIFKNNARNSTYPRGNDAHPGNNDEAEIDPEAWKY